LGALDCADEFLDVECAALGGSFVADATCADADANGDGSDDACVPLGACCGVANAPLECVDTVSDGDCTALSGTSFIVGESCTGVDSPGFGLDDTCPGAVPAVSSWGLLILGLLLASAAKLYGLYGTPDRRPYAVIKV